MATRYKIRSSKDISDGALVVLGNTSNVNTGDQTNITGNAGTVTVADAGGDTTTWVLLGTSQTGSLAPASDAGITYNATTNALTTTTFVGALTGDVTGNVSGTAGTVTTNANLSGDVSSVGNSTTIGAGKVVETMLGTTDITTNDATTSKHGYMMKYPGGTTTYLRADGTFATVTASAPDIALNLLAPSVDETITAGYSAYMSDFYEIADGKFLEIGNGAVCECG